jgi:tetratricopeptide (TPR) repeat protein
MKNDCLLQKIDQDILRPRQEPFEEMKRGTLEIENTEDLQSAIQDLKDWISWNSFVPEAFVLLAELYERAGREVESIVCFQRALELNEVLTAREPSQAALHLLNLEKQFLEDLSALEIDGIIFPRLRLLESGPGMTLIGRSFDQAYFIKFEVCPNPLKMNTLQGEASILRKLNDAGCISCPKLHSYGKLAFAELEKVVESADWEKLSSLLVNQIDYYIQEYLPSEKGYSYADIALTLLEQKALGIYHGDIRPENIRFTKERGIISLIDYDQSVILPDSVRQMDNRSFFKWCIEFARENYKRWHHLHFLSYFKGIDLDRDFWPLFRGDALNLGHTSVFQNQITTAGKQKIYHTIETSKVFIQGERSLDDRKEFLDSIDFAEGETVLDVGCSSGILSMYLAGRGCHVKGVEIDAKLIVGNRLLANILGLSIDYVAMDLDLVDELKSVDTVCLFSVIHHTKHLQENGRKIARACRKRILIECRLVEIGLKWNGRGFERSSAWDYPDLYAMTQGLEKLFPGFVYNTNYGQGDRDRYLLEFVKV